MLQFYFLSILLNLIAGLIFIYAVKDENDTSLVLSDSDDPFAEGAAASNTADFNPETDELDLNLDGNSESSDAVSEKSKSASKEGGFKSLALPFLGVSR